MSRDMDMNQDVRDAQNTMETTQHSDWSKQHKGGMS